VGELGVGHDALIDLVDRGVLVTPDPAEAWASK
jgi:hypothetical protein